MGAGQRMIPDAAAQARFQNFLKTYHGKKLVVLELGIGWRNQLIKAPMMRLVASEPNATYVTINLGEVYIADNIKEKSFGLWMDGWMSCCMHSGQRAEQLKAGMLMHKKVKITVLRTEYYHELANSMRF